MSLKIQNSNSLFDQPQKRSIGLNVSFPIGRGYVLVHHEQPNGHPTLAKGFTVGLEMFKMNTEWKFLSRSFINVGKQKRQIVAIWLPSRSLSIIFIHVFDTSKFFMCSKYVNIHNYAVNFKQRISDSLSPAIGKMHTEFNKLQIITGNVSE